MKKLPISVIIPVKDEEKNIRKCIENLNQFSEVLVVDSNSSDKTIEIVESLGIKHINFDWNGKYPKKRNWVLNNYKLKNDWVLFLDADEFIDSKFINEIKQKINNDFVGYWIYYNNYFMGHEIKYGIKMRKLALFRKSSGRYEKIDEDNWTSLDMEIHEHPILAGKVSSINTPVSHRDFNNIEHYINKHNKYSTWEARRYKIINQKRKKLELTSRQRIKYFLIYCGLLPHIYFILTYFIMLGFLDGKAGLRLATFKFFYFYQIQSKITEQK